MKHRYDNWVGGLNGDWLISRQRFFGIPFPVWYPLDADGEPDYDHPLLPREDELPIDPSTDAPARLHRGPARQARRLHRRPRRDGHLGDLVADPADRRRLGVRRRPVAAGLPDGPVHPGARHHPHLAVLPRRPRALREPRRAVVARPGLRLHPRPGPQEDVEVQGQRRRPDRDPRQVRRRRRPLARRDGPPGPGLAVRRDPDEGRPPAGDEGPQRLEVRPRRRRRDRVNPFEVSEPVDCALLGRLAEVVGKATDAFEAYDYTTALEAAEKFFWEFCDDYLELVKERAYAEDGGAGHRLGQGDARDRARRPAAAARAVPALRDRGGLVVVAGGLDPPRRLADRRRARLGRRGRPGRSLDAVAAALVGIRGAKSNAKVSMRAELSRVEISGPEALVARRRAGRATTCARPARSPATWSSPSSPTATRSASTRSCAEPRASRRRQGQRRPPRP